MSEHVVRLTEDEANRLRMTLVLSHPSAVWINVRAAVVHILTERLAEAEQRQRDLAAKVEAVLSQADCGCCLVADEVDLRAILKEVTDGEL